MRIYKEFVRYPEEEDISCIKKYFAHAAYASPSTVQSNLFEI